MNADKKNNEPVLLGGLGEKVSNGGTQYYFQDRVYSSESVAVSITTAFNPYYLVKVKNEDTRNTRGDNKI